MKTALVFPGQGSQYIGMGKKLYDNFSIAKDVFNEVSDALEFNLKELCFNGSIDELSRTENAQPAILTVSVAAFRVYMEEVGIEPEFIAGHSLGEYSALVNADSINLSDAARIVNKRGKFMQGAVPVGVGSMVAINGIESEIIKSVCSELSEKDKIAAASNFNSSKQTVISGNKEIVKTAGNILKEKGAKVIPLKVSAPFHSPLMQPAAERLYEELLKYSFGELKYKVISNVTALPYNDSSQLVDHLVRQITEPVRWHESMMYLQNQGIDTIIEIGPKNVLCSLMKDISDSVKSYSFDKEEDINSLKLMGNKGAGKKAKPLRLLTRCLAIAVCTPNKNWNNEEYNKGVIEPYKKIEKLVEMLEGKEPDKEQMREALDMLRSVFATKRTPVEEQVERFNQIFNETGTRYLFPDFISHLKIK